MSNSYRKIGFIIAATNHGTLIVNRFDQRLVDQNRGYGVGFQLLNTSSYDASEVDILIKLLSARRQHYGDGVVAVDCGANIGVHTIEWAKHMNGWGTVLSIEAQEHIYYALAGNIAINNCFNVHAIHAAVTDRPGIMKIPNPDYLTPGSFGSLELRKGNNTEYIGQPIDYSEGELVEVRAISLDSLNLSRLDLVKIDVEGMELDALNGGIKCIRDYHPILIVEMIKTDKNQLRERLESLDYSVWASGMNFLALHKGDKCLANIKFATPAAP